ncbi:MAG: hypothetical protein O2894_01185 [Planctomycetota bacterium]|nr:hypothetical protein [Planctomycetota bacterium]
MRALSLVLVLLFAGSACADDTEETPVETGTAETAKAEPAVAEPAPIAATAVAVGGTVAAVGTGAAADEVLVGLSDGALLRWTVGQGATWRGTTGGEPADALVAAPRGGRIAVTTAAELLVFGSGTEPLWRAPRPMAFAFSADGSELLAIGKHALAVYAVGTGEATRKQDFADKREIVQASLHPASGLAVLGVADG